jgi:hypothetical protein
MAINSIGYVGLNVLNASERLHLASGNIRVDNSDKGIILSGFDGPFITRNFDSFTSGNYQGLGRWGLFMEPSRITIGLPNLSGKAFEIAKYNLNGSRSPLLLMDVNGALQINGSNGTPGQVLTSAGTGATAWQTLSGAFENNIRFEASFTETGPVAVTPAVSYTQYLNTNPSAVSISSGSITINQSGLYHIEGYSEISLIVNTTPQVLAQHHYANIDSRTYAENIMSPLIRDGTALPTYKYINYGKFVHEVYIVAPGTISSSFFHTYTPGGAVLSSSTHRGRISGYLISQ